MSRGATARILAALMIGIGISTLVRTYRADVDGLPVGYVIGVGLILLGLLRIALIRMGSDDG